MTAAKPGLRHLDVDLAIVGAGSAGMAAYKAAARHTSRLVVIESSGYGTLCARAGCMPSKLLIEAASRAHAIRQAHRFGIQAVGARVDGAAVMARLRELRDYFVDSVIREAEAWPAAHRLTGRARFIGPCELQVDDHAIVKARSIVLATGSRAVVPDAWREAIDGHLLTTDTLFELPSLPRSIAVIGGGAIGTEMAQALSRLGVRVVWLMREDAPGGLRDPALRPLAIPLLSEGITLITRAEVRSMAEAEGGQARVEFDANGERGSAVVDKVLVCIGRQPVFDGLDLDKGGLTLNKEGLVDHEDRSTRVGESCVFLAGDVSGAHPLLHEAVRDGRRAATQAVAQPGPPHHLPEAPLEGGRRTALRIVFCDPQIAAIGRGHEELTRSHHPFVTGVADFTDQGRSRIKDMNRGALRVYVCRDRRVVLGAEMIGPCAEHLAHLLAWSVHQGQTIDTLLDCPIYHPVVEEAVRTALGHARAQLAGQATMRPASPLSACADMGIGL
ncbi:dihydrolipoyl dehydrogenase [Aquabacterium soli]|uniref:Dihydrolipoyl dehydrogenase n=1 Tax=Aquabacterium soli TaxID=2493092 RepID=A0A426VHB9_9BURK|nr:dihydrolipoyl dehydrogenase [Aquabacterium soli]RRS06292.1 dihydrolipoyl dehydrogenase [Aquabacterium soli]